MKKIFRSKNFNKNLKINKNISNEKEEQLKICLEENEKIPHHLRKDAKNVLENIIYNIKEEEKLNYTNILVTTSLNPGCNLRTFSKHLALIFNGNNLVRAKLTQSDISEHCIKNKITHLIIVNETKGNPSSIILCKYPHGKTYFFNLTNLKFERRIKSLKKKLNLIIDGFDSEIGLELKKNLSLMCPLQSTTVDSNYNKNKNDDRVIGFINRNGIIAVRHFIVEKKKLKKDCSFDLKLYKITNGTFEMEGDVDYILRAYTNTIKQDILKE